MSGLFQNTEKIEHLFKNCGYDGQKIVLITIFV